VATAYASLTKLEGAPSNLRLGRGFLTLIKRVGFSPDAADGTTTCRRSDRRQHRYPTQSQRTRLNGAPSLVWDLFISALETVRQQYELFVYGFVVMPEHVH
jgi:hypothetical protein